MKNEQIVAEIRAGRDTAGNMLLLYQKNKGLIYTIAQKYMNYAELDDLMQEGYIWLSYAVDHYELDASVKFSCYAWKVIGRGMQKYIYHNSGLNMPEYMAALLLQYKKLCSSFAVRYDRTPIDREICKYLNINKKQLDNLKKTAETSKIASLDSPISEEGEVICLQDTIESQESIEDEAVDHVQQYQLKRAVWAAVDNLPERRARIIRKRYADGFTLKDTGKALGISPERVRVEEKRALKELGRIKAGLREFADDMVYNKAVQGNGVGTFNRTWTSSTEGIAISLTEELDKMRHGQQSLPVHADA